MNLLSIYYWHSSETRMKANWIVIKELDRYMIKIYDLKYANYYSAHLMLKKCIIDWMSFSHKIQFIVEYLKLIEEYFFVISGTLKFQ